MRNILTTGLVLIGFVTQSQTYTNFATTPSPVANHYAKTNNGLKADNTVWFTKYGGDSTLMMFDLLGKGFKINKGFYTTRAQADSLFGSIFTTLDIEYNDLDAGDTTYTNIAFANKAVKVTDIITGRLYTSTEASGFNSSGVLEFNFVAHPLFKARLYGSFRSGEGGENNFPITSSSSFNNSAKKILGIDLYGVDLNDNYYISKLGYNTDRYVIAISRSSDDAEIVRYESVNYSGVQNEYVKFTLVRSFTNTTANMAFVTMKASLTDVYTTYLDGLPGTPYIDKFCLHEGQPYEDDYGTQLAFANSMMITDSTALYAHESTICALKKNIVVGYSINRDTFAEGQEGQALEMEVINKQTKTKAHYVLAAPGNTYGSLVIPSNGIVYISRNYKLNDSIVRCFFHYGIKCYYRDFNENTRTFGNPVELLARISGGVTPVTLDSTNIRLHLQGVTGTTSANFSGLSFLMGDQSTWYWKANKLYMTGTFISFTDRYYNITKAITVLMESSDYGATWTLKGVVYQGGVTSTPVFFEGHVLVQGTTWFMFVRESSEIFKYAMSTDGGATFGAAQYGLFPNCQGFRHAGIQYSLKDSIQRYTFIYNMKPQLYAMDENIPKRSILAFSSGKSLLEMQDFAFFQFERTCHYPSIYIDGGTVYVAYTTAENYYSPEERRTAIRFVPMQIQNIMK